MNDSRDFQEPPLYFLLAPAERMHGNHTNHVWRGQVGHPSYPDVALPMVVKLLKDGKIPLCVELACALAAQALDLPVPAPALVVVERDDLGALPGSIVGDRLLLIGSHYKKADALYTQMACDHAAAEEFVWDRLCASETGAKGAAWDELVANEDRHSENLLFDGLKWWLFDHDLALPGAGRYIRADATPGLLKSAHTFQAKCNELASQMIQRRPSNHAIDKQARQFDKHKSELWLLACYAKAWRAQDESINDVFRITAILLNKIYLRLPALAQHLHNRMARPESNSLWTSQIPPSPAQG